MERKLRAVSILIVAAVLACLCASGQILNAIIGTAGSGAGQTFTFYVSQSTGSDSNPGTQAQPFQTIAKVNTLTLTAGQSVGFKTGDTWREMLSIPASGSAGRPITFGSYGLGSAPIINGSNTVAGSWTQTRVTQFSDTLNHNGTNGSWTVTGTGVSFTSNQLQVVLSATTGTHRVTDVYNASPPSEMWCTYQVFIPSGFSVPDGAEGFSSGLYNASNGHGEGAVGYHSTSGTLFWRGVYKDDTGTPVSTTQITPNVTHTVLIHLVTGAGTGSFTYWVDGVQLGNQTGLTNNVNLPTQALLGEGFVGSTVTISGFYSNFAIYSGTDSANTWQTALTTQPNIVILNGNTPANGVGSVPTTYNSVDGNWFWSGNVLYLSSTSNPGTRFTSVEAGARDSAIDTAGKSHIAISGLSLQKSNGVINGGLTIGTTSDISINNCEMAYNANAGVYITSVAGGTLSITNNSMHNNAFGVLSWHYTGAGLGTEAVVSNNLIFNNTYTGSGGTTWTFPEAVQMNGNYFIVQYNTISNNGNPAGDGIAVHIYTDDGVATYGHNNIIRYNVISGQISNGFDGSAVEIDHDGNNNQVYGNTAYGNQGPCVDIFGASSNLIANNTCYNNFQNPTFPVTKAEIALSSSGSLEVASSNIIENNILYATQSGAYAFSVSSDTVGGGNTARNNLLFDSGQSNWYFWSTSGGNSLATFNTLSGVSANLNGDPLFVNPGAFNFTLQSGSPAINAGVCIAGVTPCPTNIGAK